MIWNNSHFQVRLDEAQVQEQEALRAKLQQEQDLLSRYQERQTSLLKNHIEKELEDLQNRVTRRRALLEERVSVCFGLYIVVTRHVLSCSY